MKEQDIKWLATGHVRPEAIVRGKVKSIIEEKQRFYYHRYIYIQTLELQSSTKIITAKKITPLTKDFKLVSFTIGDVIHAYGGWEGNTFLFSQYESEKR
ncbi:hypothetical protein [Neobacillus jeddahensis]|nr:hypothetical protein [Neobacillus jeddahensis]